jgi:hypothetical protein
LRASPPAGTDRLTATLAAAPVVAILRARPAGHLVAAAATVAGAGTAAEPPARARTVGALAVGSRADWEGLPGLAELPLVEHPDEVVR